MIATISSTTLLWHSSSHSLYNVSLFFWSQLWCDSFHISLDLYFSTGSASGIYLIPSWWIVSLYHSFLMLHSPITIHIHKRNNESSYHKPITHKLHNYTTLLLETNASSPNGSFNGSRLKRWRYTTMVTLGLKRIDPLKALITNTNSTPWPQHETTHQSVLSSVTEPTNWKLHR